MGREDALRGRAKPALGAASFPGVQTPLRDSGGNPLGPGRLGQVRLAGQGNPLAPSRPVSRALRGPDDQLAEAKRTLDKAQVTAQQIGRTFDILAQLIGEDAAATAAEQAADSLESASDQYEEARRAAAGAD